MNLNDSRVRTYVLAVAHPNLTRPAVIQLVARGRRELIERLAELLANTYPGLSPRFDYLGEIASMDGAVINPHPLATLLDPLLSDQAAPLGPSL